MREIKYNNEQITELLNNKYVKSCTPKNISFTKEWKIEAVKLWKQWLTAKEIFKKQGFPNYILKSEIPSKSINRWNRLSSENYWIVEFKKWRKNWFKWNKNIKINKLNDKEKIEFLETEVAYLKELYKEKHWFYP